MRKWRNWQTRWIQVPSSDSVASETTAIVDPREPEVTPLDAAMAHSQARWPDADQVEADLRAGLARAAADGKWEVVEILNTRSRHLNDIIHPHTEGTVLRVRPKLMTVSTMLIGLVPLLWATGSGADRMKRIAAPMVGGLITSAFLTLEPFTSSTRTGDMRSRGHVWNQGREVTRLQAGSSTAITSPSSDRRKQHRRTQCRRAARARFDVGRDCRNLCVIE
jgi:hypothetical protein